MKPYDSISTYVTQFSILQNNPDAWFSNAQSDANRIAHAELTRLHTFLWNQRMPNSEYEPAKILMWHKKYAQYNADTHTIHIPTCDKYNILDLARMVAHETDHAFQYMSIGYTREENVLNVISTELYPARTHGGLSLSYRYNYKELQSKIAEITHLVNAYYAHTQQQPLTTDERQKYYDVCKSVYDDAVLHINALDMKISLFQDTIRARFVPMDLEPIDMTKRDAITFLKTKGLQMLQEKIQELRVKRDELCKVLDNLKETPNRTTPITTDGQRHSQVIQSCIEQGVAMLHPNDVSNIPTNSIRLYGVSEMMEFIKTNDMSRYSVIIPNIGATEIYCVIPKDAHISTDIVSDDNIIDELDDIINQFANEEIYQEEPDEEEVIE